MESPLFSRLKSRYKSAYSVAGFLIVLGVIIKVFGLAISAVYVLFVLIVGIATGRLIEGFVLVFLSIIIATINAFIAFITGTVVAALGEMLQAVLDSAVNSSPHVNNDEKVEIMRLSLKEPEKFVEVAKGDYNYKRLREIVKSESPSE